MSTPRQLSFCDLATRYEALSQNGDPLDALAVHVPWEAFRPTLDSVLHRSKRNKGGRPPFDAVLMFNLLVLQALYNLSDDHTESQIRDRLSFMRFLGLDLDQRIPDAKTIWLFRETLTQADVVETLFEQFETYLVEHGLQPRGGRLMRLPSSPCRNNAIPARTPPRLKPGSVRPNGRSNGADGGRKTQRPAGRRNMGPITMGIRTM